MRALDDPLRAILDYLFRAKFRTPPRADCGTTH